jgi:hypothetical protein
VLEGRRTLRRESAAQYNPPPQGQRYVMLRNF